MLPTVAFCKWMCVGMSAMLLRASLVMCSVALCVLLQWERTQLVNWAFYSWNFRGVLIFLGDNYDTPCYMLSRPNPLVGTLG